MSQTGDKTHYFQPLLNPEHYAQYRRRTVKAVTREDLGHRIQFTSARTFAIGDDNRLSDFRAELDAFTKEHRLGNLIWALYTTVLADNFREFVDELERRRLYLFDIWGYVPGLVPERDVIWGEYKAPQEKVDYVRAALGPRFLGFDNGEQDGRYVALFVDMMCPVYDDRKRHYFNFHEHFEELGNAMHNQTAVLCSLNFGHYFAREGNAVLLGAENAQGLLNTNMWYAYLRGAGKQYGLLWFGNASVWNRWGYKSYEPREEGETNPETEEWGPEEGTSLSLLRRIMYTHYMYNCDILGFEWSFFTDKQMKRLSPVGHIQSDAVRFVERHGSPGAMVAPVAMVMDFFNGWVPPRHLYSTRAYMVWGGMPYEDGDYQTHALFSLLYPGYENAGFFRDERGFLTATPYGDIADVLFSDVGPEVLGTYGTAIVAGPCRIDAELYDKLVRYVEQGGHLIVSMEQALSGAAGGAVGGVIGSAGATGTVGRAAGGAAEYFGFFGAAEVGGKRSLPDGDTVEYRGTHYAEQAFELYPIVPTPDAATLATVRSAGLPLVVRVKRGAGRVSLIASPFGLAAASAERRAIENREETELSYQPAFLHSIRQWLGDCLDEEKLIDIGNPRLQYSVCATEEGVCTVFVANNGYADERFVLSARTGVIEHAEEVELPAMSNRTAGYYAKAPADRALADRAAAGASAADADAAGVDAADVWMIAPKDIRLFRIRLGGHRLEKRGPLHSSFQQNRFFLSLRNIASLKEYVLFHPTLPQHFAGIKLDASYLRSRDIRALRKEAEYVGRQGVDVIVDFSGSLNHYPNMSLLPNPVERMEATVDAIEDVLGKARLYGCSKAVFVLHLNMAGGLAQEQLGSMFRESVAKVCALAEQCGITMYLQNGTRKRIFETTESMVALLDDWKLPNLKFAYNVCHSIAAGEQPEETAAKYGDRIDAMLLSAPTADRHAQFLNSHRPIRSSAFAGPVVGACRAMRQRRLPDFVCLDAVYADWNESYADRNLFR